MFRMILTFFLLKAHHGEPTALISTAKAFRSFEESEGYGTAAVLNGMILLFGVGRSKVSVNCVMF